MGIAEGIYEVRTSLEIVGTLTFKETSYVSFGEYLGLLPLGRLHTYPLEIVGTIAIRKTTYSPLRENIKTSYSSFRNYKGY